MSRCAKTEEQVEVSPTQPQLKFGVLSCRFLQGSFSPTDPPEGGGLAISGGMQGARLTHNHSRQYAYVLQSLTLW